jgi:hypothetical protein
MIRLLFVGFLLFVVAWDEVTAGPSNSALTRASMQLYRWTRAEIQHGHVIDRIRKGFEAARAADARSSAAALSPDIESGAGDSVFAKSAILAFVAEASARTGVSAAYLERLASRESSFNPVAAADSSSARGLYQFIDSTWLGVFARHGAEHGQAALATKITLSDDGPTVTDARARTRILDLRFDPKLATFLAAELAADNRAALEAALGRPVSDAELYIAHFLGETGAETLFETRERTPDAPAADLFPWAARANRSFFYEAGGRKKNVGALYAALIGQAGNLSGQTVAGLDRTAS